MDKQYLCDYLGKCNINLDEKAVNRLNKFYELLVEWNSFMNLTGITEYKEVVVKHFIDSIILMNYYDFSSVKNIIDIGTGAGFPGLPLKIAMTDKDVTLLDSLAKRIKFLDEVIKVNELEGIKTIHSRAEDGAHNKAHREVYDVAVSRAVASLASLTEYCLPYVKVTGHFIAYKAGNVSDEVNASKNAIKLLGGQIVEIKEIVLPDSDIARTFVIIKKINNTPVRYPRKAGVPTKEPLT